MMSFSSICYTFSFFKNLLKWKNVQNNLFNIIFACFHFELFRDFHRSLPFLQVQAINFFSRKKDFINFCFRPIFHFLFELRCPYFYLK